MPVYPRHQRLTYDDDADYHYDDHHHEHRHRHHHNDADEDVGMMRMIRRIMTAISMIFKIDKKHFFQTARKIRL